MIDIQVWVLASGLTASLLELQPRQQKTEIQHSRLRSQCPHGGFDIDRCTSHASERCGDATILAWERIESPESAQENNGRGPWTDPLDGAEQLGRLLNRAVFERRFG